MAFCYLFTTTGVVVLSVAVVVVAVVPHAGSDNIAHKHRRHATRRSDTPSTATSTAKILYTPLLVIMCLLSCAADPSFAATLRRVRHFVEKSALIDSGPASAHADFRAVARSSQARAPTI